METNQPNAVQPVKKENRIDYLDILRGIAIFFIFSANIVYFSGFFDIPSEHRLPYLVFPIDEYLDFIMFTLVDGKFYSIFSLLFGIGCAIQYKNLTKHNKSFAPFFRRRMFWLLMFGLIHLVFIWLGDILTLYALLGFVLIWFVNFSDKKLIQIAVFLILFPIVNWIVINLVRWNYPAYAYELNAKYFEYLGYPTTEWHGIKMVDFQVYLYNDNFLDFIKMNIGNTLTRIASILEEGRVFKVLGIFIIGLWSGRKILNENLLENTQFLKKVAIIGICIGLPVSIVRTGITFYSDHNDFWSSMITLSYAFGTVPLALGYAALLALFYKKKMTFLNWFAPVGKMALTNYLIQTFTAITFFYGIGFGFSGKFGFTAIMCIALIVFFLQILFSKWWLESHKFGPMEWLWRQLTYGKIIKKNK